MTITPELRAEIVTMRDDGDVTKLDDNRIVRLKIEPDDTNPFDDCDTYGKVAWLPDRIYDRHGDRIGRPDGFTGNAEKLWAQQNGGQFWWEPPEDGPKRTDPEAFRQMRSEVNDLASFGCNGYILELCDGTDAYGRPIVVNTASLWGLEPFMDSEYSQTIIGELLDELDIPS